MIKVAEKEQSMGQYTLYRDDEKKRLIFDFQGYLVTESLPDFFSDYENIRNSINRFDTTTLVLETSKLKVT